MNDTTLSLSSNTTAASTVPATATTTTTSSITSLQPSMIVDESDLTSTLVTHLSLDELNEIHQSAEMLCMMQNYHETTTFDNNSEYCLSNFDTILCWPRTPRGTLVRLPCFDELYGLQYDSSRKY